MAKNKRKTFLISLLPLILLLTIGLAFFWKTIFVRLSPFPGDMLVGAYYPWLNQRWGYDIGVPIKNPLISDVFSQIYIWKTLIADSYLMFKLPLWNPFSYSGYPLLANFQSGAFNPLNIFFMVFDYIHGWDISVVSQIIISLLSMYLFLRSLNFKTIPSIIGSIIYGFNGFLIVWLLFLNVGFVFAWLPLAFLLLNLYFQGKGLKYLALLPIVLFLVISAGHFQSSVFSLIAISAYTLFLVASTKNYQKIPLLMFIAMLSFMLASIQLLPTFELSKHSVRFTENYISDYNFGLIPLRHLATFIAPDYYGNPTTQNYSGAFNYNETVVYIGIFALISLLFSLIYFKKFKSVWFFIYLAVFSLLLTFDTPFGRLVYSLNLPGLSTSSAGRNIFLLSFSAPIITSYFINNLSLFSKKQITIPLVLITFLASFLAISAVFGKNTSSFPLVILTQPQAAVAFRNMFLPILLIFMFSIILLISRIFPKLTFIIIPILIFDLFRFGWKYTPFVSRQFFYPLTEATNFLSSQTDLFRIEREQGALLPPNTWAAFRLSSTSGYDPLAPLNYSSYYASFINSQPNPTPTRYTEISDFDAKKLGFMNVKYLLVLKNNKGVPDSNGSEINYKVNLKDWKPVKDDGAVRILENTYFEPRFSTNSDSKVSTISSSAGKYVLEVENNTPSTILIKETWMPGWQVLINGVKGSLSKDSETPYFKIELPSGKSKLEIFYYPSSIQWGTRFFIIGLLLNLSMFTHALIKRKK